MTVDVLWLEIAERDLDDIADYIATHDSLSNAKYVIEKLLAATASLASHPEAGTRVKELEGVASREYRQVFFKPYRVIYRIMGKKIFIYVVADGRRDMQVLLMRRLLAVE
jgi:toxin ParE1/3/4